MSRLARRPAELRESWRLLPRGDAWARRRRTAVRLAVTLLAVGLGFVWWRALFDPLVHPDTGVLVAFVPEYEEPSPGSMRFVRSVPLDGNEPIKLSTAAQFADLADRLQRTAAGPEDVAIVYVQAEGVVLDGRPYLLCGDYSLANPEAGRFPLEQLLDVVGQSPAGTKLLLLDPGGREYDPRLGILASEFPQLSAAAVEKSTVAGLWMLSAYSPYEQSHFAPALKRTIFAHFAGRGLAGEGDSNGDRVLDVGELFRFVHTNVAAWTDANSAGYAGQTPMLTRAGGFDPAATTYPVVLPAVPATPFGLPPALVAAATATPSSSAPAAAPAAPAAPTPSPTKPADAKPAAPAASPSATAPAATGPTQTAATPGATPSAPAPPSPAQAALTAAVGGARVPPIVVRGQAVIPTVEMQAGRLVELNRRNLATAETRYGGTPVPADFAAPWWRDVQRRVARFDDRFRSATTDRSDGEMRRFAAGLAEYVDGRTPAPAFASLNRTAVLRAPPPLDVESLGSWALVERYADDGGDAPDEALLALARSLDEAFAGADRGRLDEIVAKPWPDRAATYEEFRHARRLAGLDGTPWTTLRAAWLVRREGERIAANFATSVPSIARQVAAADRRTEAGLRTLVDRIGADCFDRADADFVAALAGYRAADDGAAELRQAERLAADLVFRAERWTAWCAAGEGDPVCAPTPDALLRLFDELTTLVGLIEDADRFDVDQIAERRRRLERQVADVGRPLSDESLQRLMAVDVPLPARRRRIEVVLGSGLLPTERADELRRVAAEIDADPSPPPARTTPLDLPESARVARRFERLEGRIAVEERRAALAKISDRTAGDSRPESLAAPLVAALAAQDFDPRQAREAVREASRVIAATYAALPAALDDAARLDGKPAAGDERAARLHALRSAARVLRAVDVRDADRMAQSPPSVLLRIAVWFDVLNFQRNRILRRALDASPDDVDGLRQSAELLARAARTLPRQPPPADAEADRVRLSGPSRAAPSEETADDLSFAIEAVGGGAAERIYLIVDFDSELVELTPPPQVKVYERTQFDLELVRREAEAAVEVDRLESAAAPDATALAVARDRLDSARRAAEYPRNPALAEFSPSLEMNVGERRELKFGLRRKAAAAGRSKVVVRAVAGPTHVRREVEVLLPALEQIALSIADGGGPWSPALDGLILHPWPNRTSDYQFQLTNRGGAERVVDVEFIAPERRLEGSLPVGLRTLETSEVLSLVGPAKSLVKIDDLKLPADGRPVTLAAPEPKAPAAPPQTPEERNRAVTTVGKTATDDKQPPVSVRQGMLLIVRRRDTQETLLRRIDFRPERPRRFVRPRVGYDAAAERIVIRVTPVDRTTVPAGGINVRCEFPEPLARGTVAKLEGTIQAPDYEANLFIEAPLSESRVQTVYLTVDDYPRAFVYEVPCSGASTDLPEATDRLVARVIAPANETMLQAPTEAVVAKLEIDAPPGSFDNDRDLLEVGIDRDRDRDFAGEPTLRLKSDRQADVFLQNFGRNGIVTLRTDVRDFTLSVPAGGLQNVRVNLASRLEVGPRVAWSTPVEIGLDSAGPKITRVELRPDRLVVAGVDLEVDVWSVDGEMSGTAAVEVGFDLAALGTFDTKAPPVKAERKTPPYWTAKLPTKELQPGAATLLVRATDRVGNVGEITKVKLQVVSAADAAAMKAAGSRIAGTVRYGGEPVAGARVVLEGIDQKEVGAPATTDAAGFFALENVPPGAYQLAARGLARNKPRTAKQPVAVPPAPQKVPRIELDLR